MSNACGCAVTVDTSISDDNKGYYIVYCPLHRDAEQTANELKRVTLSAGEILAALAGLVPLLDLIETEYPELMLIGKATFNYERGLISRAEGKELHE